MPQHINLYAAARKPKGALVSLRGIAAMGAALVFGFVLLSWVEARRVETLRAQTAQDRADIERLTRQLKQMPNDSADNAEKISAEEREIVALETVAARLSAGMLGQSGSFTEALKGFGRATTEGVWLTGIRLAQGHGRMALEGKALDAARVPALIEALSQQPQFAGTAFATLEIKREEGKADADAPIRFRITALDSAAAGQSMASTRPASAAGTAAGSTPSAALAAARRNTK
jgi:hypothetical protein